MSNDGMNGEVGVRILTLSDCDYCIWLKNELDANEISYTNIDAEVFSDFSDEIENKLKTDTYPMVFIDLGPNVIALVGETDLETNETLRTFDSIPELIGIIKSYIK
jgi:glutaredoxin